MDCLGEGVEVGDIRVGVTSRGVGDMRLLIRMRMSFWGRMRMKRFRIESSGVGGAWREQRGNERHSMVFLWFPLFG